MMPNRPCKQHIPFGKSLGKTIMTPSSSQISYVGGGEEGSEGVEKPGKRRNFVLPENSKKRIGK